MPILYSYPQVTTLNGGDLITGTQVSLPASSKNPTVCWTIDTFGTFISSTYCAQRVVSYYQWNDVAPEAYFNFPNGVDTNIPFNATQDVVSQIGSPSIYPTRKTAGISPAAATTFEFPAQLYGWWMITLKIHFFDQFGNTEVTAGVRNRTGGGVTYLKMLIDTKTAETDSDKIYQGTTLLQINGAINDIDFVINPSANTPFPSATGNAPCEVIMEWIAPN